MENSRVECPADVAASPVARPPHPPSLPPSLVNFISLFALPATQNRPRLTHPVLVVLLRLSPLASHHANPANEYTKVRTYALSSLGELLEAFIATERRGSKNDPSQKTDHS
eukprot:4909792-Pyramimonas_sp.AAC.1